MKGFGKKGLLSLLIAGLLLFCFSCADVNQPELPTDGKPATEDESAATTAKPDSGVPTGNAVPVVSDGVANFRIVRTGSTDSTIANAASRIQELVLMLTGTELPIIAPRDMQAGERLIIVGTRSGQETVQAATDALDIGTYGYRYADNCLMVIGRCDATLSRAISKFCSALTSAAKKGELTLEVGENGVFENYNNWPTDIPLVEKAFSSVYDCGNQTYQLFYRNAEAALCGELEGLLTAEGGFVRSQGGTVGENRAATYVRKDCEVSYLYSPATKTFRVVCQRYDGHYVTIPSVQPETDYEKTGETQFALLPLNYAVACADPTDCSGFSAVLTLEDGRFIVFDGGYSADAEGLYHYLEDHNRRADGITVAAWVLTHAHEDHIGCFKRFAEDFGKQVTVSYLITNALPETVKPTNEANPPELAHAEIWCGSFRGETKIIKMHAGQSVWFCNAELQMLFTQETLQPATVNWLNETSTVLMIRVNGQKLLITADCELQETEALIRLWGSELQADLYQINHHGYGGSGATPELVRLVNPDVAFWPTSEATAANRRKAAWYLALREQMKQCIVADGDAVILTLPYHVGDSTQYYSMNFGKKESDA